MRDADWVRGGTPLSLSDQGEERWGGNFRRPARQGNQKKSFTTLERGGRKGGFKEENLHARRHAHGRRTGRALNWGTRAVSGKKKWRHTSERRAQLVHLTEVKRNRRKRRGAPLPASPAWKRDRKKVVLLTAQEKTLTHARGLAGGSKSSATSGGKKVGGSLAGEGR